MDRCNLRISFLYLKKHGEKAGSKTFAEVGSRVSVNDLLHGVIVQSGNDAAIVLAEGIAGTEDAFAEEMNYWEKTGYDTDQFSKCDRMARPRFADQCKRFEYFNN